MFIIIIQGMGENEHKRWCVCVVLRGCVTSTTSMAGNQLYYSFNFVIERKFFWSHLRLRGEDFFFLSSLSFAFYFLYPIEYGRVRVYYIKSTGYQTTLVTNISPPSFSQSATCTKRFYRACRLETRPCLGSMARHDLG